MQAVRHQGTRLRVAHLDIRAVRSARPHPRIGIVVPRHAHDAVARNRLKRRLREVIRTRLIPRLPPVDIVVWALPSAYTVAFATLEAQLERAAGLVSAACGAS